ncbi:Carboxylic ester hydrolase [Mycena sanguinolenta]|uniref:Carboxylic ester hydrolase n=1 Tax=Mycena sanguinolenta TaxID=230812 RepID=A0A8H6ZDI9_9AGAR|nr:Carboxylic ester hydrolase [Mycena sanguinolenta]
MKPNTSYRLGASVLLANSLLKVHASPQASPAVSLLFQNDGNWTNYANLPSALIFYDAVTFDEAEAICRANNETLLSSTSLKALTQQFTYLEYLKDITPTTRYWISTGATTPLSSSNVSQAQPREKLQFLCTNSAPHTTIVDTDFSASPRTTVTSNGIVYTGTRDHLTFRFMGIPYAQPPVGPLRFKDPEPWNGTAVDATFFKPVCLQFGFFGSDDFGLMPWGNSEDCLNLHVFTPYIPSSNPSKSAPALKPVLFWIHGGGNTQGTGEDATFDGGSLVSRTDSVVVTVDHRLNIFGYLGLDDAIKGNYAIADKVAALQWVHDNIAQFGGDPERVMIFGQSAGGSSVIELVKTPKARGLFSAAISQSGGGSPVWQNYTAAAAAVLPELNVFCNSTGAERLACLQALPADTILNITNTVTTWMGVVDGEYVVNDTVSQVSQGPSGVNSVAYMAGFMPEEGESLLGTTIAPNMTEFDPGSIVGEALGEKILASGLWNPSASFTPYNATIYVYTDWLLTCPAEEMITAAANADTFPSLYVYEMQRAYALSYFDAYDLCTFPVGNIEPPYYRCHSGDLYEVFGTYYIFDQPVRNVRDIEYTTMIQDMWGSFARTGNPNPPSAYLKARGYQSTLDVLSHFTWPQYTAASPRVAQLQYPGISTGTLPDIGRCVIIDS